MISDFLMVRMSSTDPTSLVRSAFADARAQRRRLLTSLDSRTLDNGSRVHVLAQGSHGIAAVEIWARIGAGDESAEKAGISHLLEHLMFRGTHTIPDGEFDIRVQALGARANAWTWYDTTAYTSILSAEHLPELLALEADRFAHLNITETVFQTERDVVLNERALTADSDPNALAHEHLDRMLFGAGPYARPVIGSKENIAAFTRDQLSQWYAQHYAPHALDIFIVGDIDPAQTHRLVAETFGQIHATPPPSKAEAPRVEHRSNLHERIELGVAEPLVLMAWGMPEGRDRRSVLTWRVMSEILAFARGGQLRTALEHTQRMALYQDFYVQEHRQGHSAVWEATPRDGVSMTELCGAFYATLGEIADRGLSDAIVHAAQIRLLSDWASRNAPWQVLQQLGDALHTADDVQCFVEDIDHIEAITSADLQALAARLSEAENNVLLYVTPKEAS